MSAKTTARTSPAAVIIPPGSVFHAQPAWQMLGLKASTFRREVKLGRLRVAKRGGRYFLLGEWIIQWLRDGEVRRPQASEADTADA